MSVAKGFVEARPLRRPARHRPAREALSECVARERQDVLALREACEAIKQRHGAVNPQNDFERLLAVIDADGAGTSPYVATWRKGGRVVAMLMGRRSRRVVRPRFGYVRLPGVAMECLDVVYGGLLVDQCAGIRERVAEHVQRLLRERRIDHVSFNRLPTWHAMHESLSAMGGVVDAAEKHWCMELPADVNALLVDHSSKHRSNLRRLDRRLEEECDGGLRVRVFTDADEVGEFLDVAEVIAVQSYHGALGAGVQNTARWQRMLTSEAQRGRMLCYAMHGGGRAIAYQAGVRYGETYFAEGTSYLPDVAHLRPGTVLFMRVIRDLCERGVRVVDLGFGDAEYKRVYGTQSHEERSVRLYASRGAAASAGWVDRCVSAAERYGRELAERSGRAQQIRQIWRGSLVRKQA
jgi:CelD/BcsL family acetyltransferase involved in cellulose biosynthesis